MKITGALFIIVGVLLGLYVGLYVMLVGGILDIVHFIQAGAHNTDLLVWGILKVLFSETVGALSGLIPFLIGRFLWEWE